MNPLMVGALVADKNPYPHRMDIDPVCHMQVKHMEGLSYVYKDVSYHFCSKNCFELFRENPELILHP